MSKRIWLDREKHPAYQVSPAMTWLKGEEHRYAMAEFQRTYTFEKKPCRLRLRVSGDAQYRLYLNGSFIGLGPASAGGDFLMKKPLSWCFADVYELDCGKDLQFFAQVQLQPQVLTEVTGGRGSFFLEGTVIFADGSKETFSADESWQVRHNPRYADFCIYDETLLPGEWERPEVYEDPRQVLEYPLPHPERSVVYPDIRQIPLSSGNKIRVEFDRIYSAYPAFTATGPCKVKLYVTEGEGLRILEETVTLAEAGEYRSFRMHSIGEITLEVLSGEGELYPYIIYSRYPVKQEGRFECSDEELTKLYEVCKWTLQICRQTLHLDSPRHQELLACTADYYIETMMTAMTYGDLRLAALDIRRTARWLEENDGEMFHTTYSLVWVQWLEFVYQYTAEKELLEDCYPALKILLERFHSYLEDGVVGKAPSYMFVDWVVTEGYSMHHPPKSLGQTVLNAFYYKALTTAAGLAGIADWPEEKLWAERAAQLKENFNRLFYDGERYIDGLPGAVTPWKFMPQNPPIRHCSRYANALAALYDLAPKKERLIRMAADETVDLQQVQPYFMHYILQAVTENGLWEDLHLFDRWRPLIRECEKGLQEGWYKPEPTYSFDHSHAWGGTPAYHLPLIFTGLKMLEPGWKRISLAPRLWGLEYAAVEIPTPYGNITVKQKKGQRPEVTVPKEICYEMAEGQ
ncbi:MAG: hypothetical protein IJ043_03905 [Clostridia bacterium]|nr:hypothetical protein [Clostridia bacterium]